MQYVSALATSSAKLSNIELETTNVFESVSEHEKDYGASGEF